eukprot:TRINITY_DN10203_c1_g1_i1.p1 TRINITY_DN10203_c1_g1~~TRINITY_DN10203_c1_g1_i1.p1  ORF type:complete len:309 (+),score=44.84 TRINITY_DN10203_c1_g1_i1:62-988(+)
MSKITKRIANKRKVANKEPPAIVRQVVIGKFCRSHLSRTRRSRRSVEESTSARGANSVGEPAPATGQQSQPSRTSAKRTKRAATKKRLARGQHLLMGKFWRTCLRRSSKVLLASTRASRVKSRVTKIKKETRPTAERVLAHDSKEDTTEELCNETLLKLLSHAYDSMVVSSEEPDWILNSFHSGVKPDVSVEDYLNRMSLYFHCSDSCFITSFIYILRVMKALPNFWIDDRSIHRLIAASLTLSAKFNDDGHESNRHFAKVCGLALKELNFLEATLCKMLDWRLNVTCEEVEACKNALRAELGEASLT